MKYEPRFTRRRLTAATIVTSGLVAFAGIALLPRTADAQQQEGRSYYKGQAQTESSVIVDYSVLEDLGQPKTLPDLVRPRPATRSNGSNVPQRPNLTPPPSTGAEMPSSTVTTNTDALPTPGTKPKSTVMLPDSDGDSTAGSQAKPKAAPQPAPSPAKPKAASPPPKPAIPDEPEASAPPPEPDLEEQPEPAAKPTPEPPETPAKEESATAKAEPKPEPKPAPKPAAPNKADATSDEPEKTEDAPADAPAQTAKKQSEPTEQTSSGGSVTVPIPSEPSAPPEAPSDLTDAPSDAGSGSKVAMADPDAAVESDGMVRVMFEAERTDLPDGAKPALDRLAAKMKEQDDVRIRLLGYSEEIGDSPSQPRRVSLFRALSIRTYLMNKDISSRRINVHALGANVPDDGPKNRVDVEIQE